jgi:heme/copper-type cytochrome/quinol oxidase subunit 3
MNKLVTLKENKTLTLGFWIYIMTDLVLFAALFATYAVLHSHTNGGPMASELFKLPVVLLETVILLTSSFFCWACLPFC